MRFYQRHLEYAMTDIGDTRMIDLSAQQIRTMLTNLDGLAPRSRAHVRTVLKMALGLAVADGIILRNPCDSVEAPRVEKYESYALNEAERYHLVAAVDLHRLKALWHLYVDLGLRLSEGLKLRWADWNRENNTLHIRKAKGDKERVIPLTDDHVARLNAHWKYQQLERTDNPKWQERGLMFPSEVGSRLSDANMRRAFKTLLAHAGLPHHIRIHDLRHTAATNLLAAGVDLATVQYITGHADSGVLIELYAHAQIDRTRAAITKLEASRQTGS
jgi:site-specific recombinase XerD